MRERRSILRTIGWFVLGLLATALIAEGSARIAEASGPPALRWYDASTQLKVEQMDALGGSDVVFAGTSMAWQGFVPDVFAATDPGSRTAYNAGLAGGVPVVMEPWLLEEVVPRLEPDIVVWGLSSMDLSTSYGADNLERYRDALETRTGKMADAEQASARYSALVRYRTILRRPAALFGSERQSIENDFEDAAAVLGTGGERLDFEVDLNDQRAAQVEARFRNYRIDPTDLEALYRTVEALRAGGVTVVLVEMPVPGRYVDLHPEGATDVSRAHEAIVAIADLLDVRVIDLRRGFSDADFVDYTHLDQAAAADLSTRLTAALASGKDTTTPSTPHEPAEVPLTDTTRRAYTTTEALYHPLTGNGETLRVPDHWYGRYGYVHEWNAAWHQEIGTEFDVVFVGSSMMLYAGDPRVFTELDAQEGKTPRPGRVAYNTALPSSYPEDQRSWMESFVLPSFSPSLVVWGLAPRDVQAFDDGPSSCLASSRVWDSMEQARSGAFAEVPALAGLPWHDLYFSEVLTGDADPLARTELSTLGDRIDYGGGPVVEEALLPEASLALFSPTRTLGSMLGGNTDDEPVSEVAYRVCEERLTLITEAVAWLTGQGIDVFVAAMPMGDRQANKLPDGRASVAEVNALIGEAALAGGAMGFTDLSDSLPNRRFVGGAIHVDYEGSLRFTRAIVEELRRIEG